ncbi:MAG: SRPBCC family protein [Pseudomonadota bacterium]|nr:SRPBCC family protein [Pseudomonadota bacterium]
MTSIIKRFDVGADAAKAWGMISDTGGVTRLTNLITECRLDGDQRHCTMADGSHVTEDIISVDRENMRLVYTVTDGPMPLDFHCSTVQVLERGDAASVIWTVDIKPDALAEHMAPMMDMVAANMRDALA